MKFHPLGPDFGLREKKRKMGSIRGARHQQRRGGNTAQVEIPEGSTHVSSSVVLGALHGKWVKALEQGLVGGLVWGCKTSENKQKIQSHSNMVPCSSVGLGLPIFNILIW